MKKTMIRVSTLILAVIIMLCPLSVCFAVGETISLITEEVIIDLILETLKSWGISIYEWGESHINQPVRNWVYGEIRDYLNDPTGAFIDRWVTGVDFIYDNFGNRILNGTGVDIIDAFVRFLIVKYNLTDNESLDVVTPGYTLDDFTAYSLPVTLRTTQNHEVTQTIYTASTPVVGIYVSRTISGYPNGGFIFVSEEPAVITEYFNNGSGSTTTTNLNLVKSGNYYIYHAISSHWERNSRITTTLYTQYPYDDVTAALQVSGVHISYVGDRITIDTTTIELPDDDPNYDDGYSMIYYPDGSVAYLDINWPETVSIDNLPAIVSTGTIQNPGIQSVFLPIKSFINNFEDGFGLMTQLVYNLPSEIVGMALAIMGAIIIFGTIRIMKEH